MISNYTRMCDIRDSTCDPTDHYSVSLFCLRNIAPHGGVAGTAEVVPDAVAENACLTFTVFGCVLLRTKHDGIAAILPIDMVDDFIKPPPLLVLLGIVVDEIGLDC